jgi:Fe-S-cluster-containing dehydrogenase component
MKELPVSRKNVDITRRSFIKLLGVGGAGIATGVAEKAFGKSRDGELCTVFDLARCIGCGECVEACRETNGYKYPEPEHPIPKMVPDKVKVEDWSERRDVDDRLTPYNWLYIQSAEGKYNGEEFSLNIPRRCMHCRNAPCSNLCPWGAMRREPDGSVRVNTDICLGGSKCRAVCPWKIPQRQSGVGLYLDLMPAYVGNGVMYKCDRCYQLAAQGKPPACVTVCPENVQKIGPRDEMIAYAKSLAAETNGFLYGLDENGGTNTIYVSPVPFELLNTAIQKGPGRPHIGVVEDVMSKDENIGKAALLAPVAGIAAGMLTVGRVLSQDDLGEGDQEQDLQKEDSRDE